MYFYALVRDAKMEERKNKEAERFWEKKICGDFPVVQWLRLHTSTVGDPGSIPGTETKILQTTRYGHGKIN